MAEKRERRPRAPDVNESAFRVVQQATAEDDDGDAPPPAKPEKNPAAVALGRMGGKKGGKAWAEKLSAEERSDIARAAARARWSSKDEGGGA